MRKFNLIAISFFIMVSMFAQSVNFEYHPNLVSVSFSGVPNTNYIQIRYDNNNGEFTPPHFIKSSCIFRSV
jgi:hypothetical protein